MTVRERVHTLPLWTHGNVSGTIQDGLRKPGKFQPEDLKGGACDFCRGKNATTRWSESRCEPAADMQRRLLTAVPSHGPRQAGGLPRKLLVVPTGAMAPAALPAVCRPLSEVPVAWHGTQVKKYGAVKPLLAVWQNNLLAHCCFDLLQLFKRKQSREKKNYNTRRPRLINTVVLVRQQHNHVQLPSSTHAILFFSLLDH